MRRREYDETQSSSVEKAGLTWTGVACSGRAEARRKTNTDEARRELERDRRMIGGYNWKARNQEGE